MCFLEEKENLFTFDLKEKDLGTTIKIKISIVISIEATTAVFTLSFKALAILSLPQAYEKLTLQLDVWIVTKLGS